MHLSIRDIDRMADMDIKYIKMNDTLRKSKEDNPIIVLVSDMFVQPFVINGNHRIKKAFNSGIDRIEVYILDADNVIQCLSRRTIELLIRFTRNYINW